MNQNGYKSFKLWFSSRQNYLQVFSQVQEQQVDGRERK